MGLQLLATLRGQVLRSISVVCILGLVGGLLAGYLSQSESAWGRKKNILCLVDGGRRRGFLGEYFLAFRGHCLDDEFVLGLMAAAEMVLRLCAAGLIVEPAFGA